MPIDALFKRRSAPINPFQFPAKSPVFALLKYQIGTISAVWTGMAGGNRGGRSQLLWSDTSSTISVA
jgi:hypothetical protein